MFYTRGLPAEQVRKIASYFKKLLNVQEFKGDVRRAGWLFVAENPSLQSMAFLRFPRIPRENQSAYLVAHSYQLAAITLSHPGK